VADDTRDLQARLSGSDRPTLDEYLYAVRDVERRVSAAGKPVDLSRVPAGFVRPTERPRDFARHVRLLMDMMLLAFQTDSTRIITLVFANEGSNRSYPEIGVPGAHHELSHHMGEEWKQQAIAKINHFHVGQLAYFLQRMRSVGEGGGNMLDNSMVLYGSGIADGDRHNHDDLPILLAGRGSGTLKPGRHVQYRFNTPLSGLYVGMLRRMGTPVDKFADSRGELSDLV
jgi:Protein of unknown function (DUF1552)